MKVVLFCGGLGIRLREYSDVIPKPMVTIGYRPVLWHLMKYYAHYGHKDFILCLGYRADVIKDYFLNYNECVSNDFTLAEGGRKLELANTDIHDWRITFVDTGMSANIGQRLKAVQRHVGGDEVFLANYSDNLTDLPLPVLIDYFREHSPTGLFMSVRPRQSFHLVRSNEAGLVTDITDMGRSDTWINGGFFVFRNEIFDYIHEGDELVLEPFDRLMSASKLMTYRYPGFWACMDTLKDKQQLEDMHQRGEAIWQVWQKPVENATSINGDSPTGGEVTATATAHA